MMDDTAIRVMALRAKGWCCAQIVILMLLEDMDRESPDLVRSARSLCYGMGGKAGPCGALTGAGLALGLAAGVDPGDTLAGERLEVMLGELWEWFGGRPGPDRPGIACQDLIGPNATGPDPETCGAAIIESYEKLMEILAANDVDLVAYDD